MSLKIKQSKTNPFRQDTTIYLHRTNCQLCPVGAIQSYLVVRGTEDGPLFCLVDGTPLTRPWLVMELCKALQDAGVDSSKFAGHSFRIGAATTAAACEVPVDIIKVHGRWKSHAYQLYVRIPDPELAAIARTLAAVAPATPQ